MTTLSAQTWIRIERGIGHLKRTSRPMHLGKRKDNGMQVQGCTRTLLPTLQSKLHHGDARIFCDWRTELRYKIVNFAKNASVMPVANGVHCRFLRPDEVQRWLQSFSLDTDCIVAVSVCPRLLTYSV
jgi:hypothetical protein